MPCLPLPKKSHVERELAADFRDSVWAPYTRESTEMKGQQAREVKELRRCASAAVAVSSRAAELSQGRGFVRGGRIATKGGRARVTVKWVHVE